MSNELDLYPLTLDAQNRRVGVLFTTPEVMLDVNGATLVRANVTATSNVYAGVSLKVGGVIGDDTSVINEDAGAMNVVGKRYVPARNTPFEPGAGTLRTVALFDRLNVEGALRTSSQLKVGGLIGDDSCLIGGNSTAMSIVGGGKAPNRLVVVYD
jgi:hypothetical protein